ncbi:MAG: transglutaminase family protein [Rhodobiaceae bacterium]|nr:transglutaminase family protein [Rhodobiaceae bacterium]MCC0012262.1 transglutaminase family protein [Rhodobiaceae bacterium]MCC0050882.1 transglutaminase family protein [Rhodobiaceae bacterium]MCC0060823.1 transglutaminase family protein [Rhodobiaceae bacterium]
MHLKLRHSTRYTYDTPVRGIIQMLRLTPRPHDAQHILHWRIDVDQDATLKPSEDSFGNIVHTFWAEGPLESLTITVEGEVQTENTNGVVQGTPERLPLGLFLRETRLTTPNDAIHKFAGKTAGSKPTLDALHALMEAVHKRMKFDIGVTSVATTAAEAFKAKHGVCQDFAHIFIAAARSAGIPARYVSGYLREDGGREQYEAGHGWAEAWVPDLGWVGFDPANNCCPTDAYIRVACGLDYLDAGPVRGVRTGIATEQLDVEIQVTQGSNQ